MHYFIAEKKSFIYDFYVEKRGLVKDNECLIDFTCV